MPDSDLGRLEGNNRLLAALREKLLDLNVWGKIPQLCTRCNKTIIPDLSPEQINHLARLIQEVTTNAIIQDQVKQEWTSRCPQQVHCFGMRRLL